MKRLINTLKNTNQSKKGYLWRAVLISLIPSLAISFIVSFTFGAPDISLGSSAASILFGVLILSPWIETLLMIPILWICTRFLKPPLYIAIASALIWGALHSLGSPTWGIPVTWVFFVFSLCYLAWEQESKKIAIVMTASLHMLHNVIPAIACLAEIN